MTIAKCSAIAKIHPTTVCCARSYEDVFAQMSQHNESDHMNLLNIKTSVT